MAKSKKVNIKKLLEHPLISKSELARSIYPGVSEQSAKSKLYMKKNGTNGNRFTEEDEAKINAFLESFIKSIYTE